LLVTVSGCASTLPPLSCPASGGPPWRELTTAHLVLRTDLDEDAARRLVVDAEEGYDLIEQALRAQLRDGPRPQQPIHLTVFRRAEDLRSLNPQADGYFSERGNDWEPWPSIVTYEVGDRHGTIRMRHELTHRLIAYYLPTAPPWLNEGLAEVLSTVRRVGSQIEIGAWDSDLYKYGTNAQPDVREVMSADYETFGRQPGFYTEASALVHLLQSDKKGHRPQFLDYLRGLAVGERADRAWAGAFPGFDAAALEQELNGYRFITLRVDTRRIAADEPVEVRPRTRLLSEGEVHLLWMEVRSWRNLAAVAHDLEQARRAMPGSPEVSTWSALLNLVKGRRADAASDIARALAAKPDEGRFLVAAAYLEGAPDLAQRLAQAARTGSELGMAAWLLDSAGRHDEALELYRRATALAPHDEHMWFAQSQVAEGTGRWSEAEAAIVRGWALRPGCSVCVRWLRNWAPLARQAGQPAPDLTLPPSNASWGLRVTARIVDEDGHPIAAQVMAVAHGHWDVARTDREGVAHLKVPAALASFVVLPDDPSLLADEWIHQLRPSPRPVALPAMRVVKGAWHSLPAVLDGIGPANRDGSARVGDVAGGTPADRAGVRAGDRLLSVDGHDVRALGVEGINWYLRAIADGPIQITLERDGAAKTVQLTPPSPEP